MTMMRLIAGVTLALLTTVPCVSGESFDRPVTEIETDPEGIYDATFMYWATLQSLFVAEVEFVMFGEVVDVEMLAERSEEADCMVVPNCRTRVKVAEILVCPNNLIDSASGISYVVISDCTGVSEGDSLIVFMIRYEGAFAVPHWRGTNTPLGYRLENCDDPAQCSKDDLLGLIRSGHAWDLQSLSATELELWRCIDRDGVSAALTLEKEIK